MNKKNNIKKYALNDFFYSLTLKSSFLKLIVPCTLVFDHLAKNNLEICT